MPESVRSKAPQDQSARSQTDLRAQLPFSSTAVRRTVFCIFERKQHECEAPLRIARVSLRAMAPHDHAYNSELATLPNLAAALFRLENARTPHEIGERLDSLLRNLRTPQQRHLRRAFIVWVARVILPKFPGVPINVDLTESAAMLAERIDEWKAQWWREALSEGRMEGRMEGRLEGEVLRQLQKRFGELPAEAVQRIQQAKREEPMLWSERLIEAEDLHSVFE